MEEEMYTDVTFTTTMDIAESDSLNIGVALELVSFDTDERKIIGYANLYVFNEFRANSWNELIDNADAISGDVLEVIAVLDKAKNNEEICGLIPARIYSDKVVQNEDKAIDYYMMKGLGAATK